LIKINLKKTQKTTKKDNFREKKQNKNKKIKKKNMWRKLKLNS